MNKDLTAEEINVIRTLKRLAKKWPKSLWLFSASGTLCVMRCDENGERVVKELKIGTRNMGGGIDPDYCVDEIDIPNDGGVW